MHHFLRFVLCLATCYLQQTTFASPVLPDPGDYRINADTVPPVITCPPNASFQLGPNLCGQLVNYAVIAMDNLPGMVVAQASGLPTGSTFPIGVTVNAFVALDAAGNTATCSFTITVQNYSTSLLCNDQSTVRLDNDCSYPVPPVDILEPNANGCAANYLVEVDRTAPFGNGPWTTAVVTVADVNKTYQFRVTDLLTGNKCWGNATVKDSMPPTLVCQDINISCAVNNLAPAYLKDSLSISAGIPTNMDNCGAPIVLTYTEASVNLPCDTASALSGTLTRVWTAKDASNNQKTCLQKINRLRLLSDVKYPADVALGCANPNLTQEANGVPFITVGGVHFPLLPTSYCEMDANYYDTIVPQCGSTYRVRRTWKVYDLCKPLSATNPRNGVQNIDIQDTGAPTVQCPPTTTVAVNGVGCQGKIKLPDAVITDGCSGIATFIAVWTANGGGQMAGSLTNWPGNNPALRDTLGVVDSLNFTTGVATIRYVATDACGNTGTCSFTLVVTDTLPPVVACFPLITVRLSATGTAWVAADTLFSAAEDVCTAMSFKVRRELPGTCQSNAQFNDTAAFCCSDIGDTVAITLRAYDVPVPVGAVGPEVAYAHSSECTIQVRVIDPNPPLCTAPADTVVICEDFDPLLNYGDLVDRSCGAQTVQMLNDYSQFDTTCHRGLILRVFQVSDNAGHTGQCTQQVTVDYRQNYFVRFPNDVFPGNCDGTNDYGEPIFLGLECERMKVTYIDERFTVVPDACFKIERTWRIINECHYDSTQALTIVPNPAPNLLANSAVNLVGPTISANGTAGLWSPTLSKIVPTDPTETNFSTFWSVNTNGYQYKQIIKIIDNQKPAFQDCPGAALSISDSTVNNEEIWSEPIWLDPLTGLHDLSDAAVALSITANDACVGGENVTISYLLFLDLDGNGEQETVINSSQLPGFNTVKFNNAFNSNYSGGSPRSFDERMVPLSEKYGFAIQTTVVNHQKTARVRWNTSQTPQQYIDPQLPRGNHKIIWKAEDNCGNITTCQYSFTIYDGMAPTPACSGISLTRNIAPNHFLSVNVNEVPQAATDNYTPAAQLEYAVRRPGSGSGFPLDAMGNPNHTVNFTCDDLGAQSLQLWVRDHDDNASFCTLPISIQDGNTVCSQPLVSVSGTIKTPIDTGLTDVSLSIYATFPGLLPATFNTLTDSAGHYVFPTPMPTGTTYTLTPTKDGNALNGVSTFDLVLINRHILGLEPITSPYKLIAADANKSNSVTTFDVVELRKLILGVYPNSLPLLKSWRFVDAAFVFPNSNNPFQTPFPEFRTVNSLINGQAPDNFAGIKVGDVNCSAMPSVQAQVEDRSRDTLWFEMTDRLVQRGETFDLPFRAGEAVAGYQFTLEHPGLEMLDIQPGAPMQLENFAVFPTKNALTTSYDAVNAGETATFSLRFRALQTGRLQQLLRLSGNITSAEAYRSANAGDRLAVGLRFGPTGSVAGDFELLASMPNPFHEQTTIGFRLPMATLATLTVFDATGKVRYTHKADYTPGFHTLTLHRNDLGTSGVLFYKLETIIGSAVGRMILVD